MGIEKKVGISWYAAFLAMILMIAPTTVLAQVEYALLTADSIIELTNSERREEALVEYRVNRRLAAAAEEKAVDMAARSYFSHATPEGEKTWNAVREQGYEFSRVGENLAVKFSDPERVVSSWLASPGHRANMLHEKFVDIGVGIADGVYQGATTTFVVALFGTPITSSGVGGEVKGEQEPLQESAGLMASFEPEMTEPEKSEAKVDESEIVAPKDIAPQQAAAVTAGRFDSFRFTIASLFAAFWGMIR